ncbi:hypothetical protein [Pseudoxanthomonas sp. LARHCG66]
MTGIRASAILKMAVASAVLAAATFAAIYVYLAWRGARIAERAAVESLAIESRHGVRWIREFMGLSPAQLDCGRGETVIVLADLGCGTGGSIRVSLRPEADATFETREDSMYRVSGDTYRTHTTPLSPEQRDRLAQLAVRWPKSIPAGREDCLRIPSFPEAMTLCEAGVSYGIDQGDGCGSGAISPASELLDILDATLERSPTAGPIICM